MKIKIAFVLGLLVASARVYAGPIPPATCPNCIINTAAPQDAQVNLGTAAIRGTLTVSTLTVAHLNVSTLTIGALGGNGSALTNLNASQLLTGTVPVGRLSGSYTGITGLGTVAAGIWQGTLIGTQYGGSGKNWSAIAQGNLPYFSGTGVMTTLSPGTAGAVLQTNGASSNPSWNSAPALSGANFTNIAPASLGAGNLPGNVAINDASISTVSAAKVIGNISGNAGGLTGTLPLNKLAAGTLATTVVASSITATGVVPGVYGSATQVPILTVRSDGRLGAASSTTVSVSAANIGAGTLASGVVVPLARLSTGTLNSQIVASSVAPSGVAPGTYGGPSKYTQINVTNDGRVTVAAQGNIAITPSQISAGSLPSNVTVPADNILAGELPSNVVASSLNATGVTPGVYGGPTQSAQIVIGADGRLTSATQISIPGISTAAAFVDRDNNWSAHQTSASSWTFNNNISAVNITGTNFIGNGAQIASLSPSHISGGTLPATVIASSIAASGVVPAAYGSSTQSAHIVIGVDGRISSASAVTITGVPASSVPAAGVQPGTLGNTVIASSIAATGISPGTYGSATQVGQATFGGDGRATSASNVTIQIPESQVTNLTNDLTTRTSSFTITGGGGLTVTYGVLASTFSGNGASLTNLTAANISAGTLGPAVIASSVAATGVTAGSYGTASSVPSLTLGADGRASAASNTSILITESQVTNLTNDLTTRTSSFTIKAPLLLSGTSEQLTGPNGYITGASSITANAFFGDGANLTSLNATQLTSGSVPDARLVGISSTCTSGMYLNSATYINGLTKGGSCVAAGTGDATLASTQTFSGANTFTSTITVGPTVYTATVTLTSGALMNNWMMVASSSFSSVSLVAFNGFESTGIYKAEIYIFQNTSDAVFRVRFNNDTGNNYAWKTLTNTNGGGGAVVETGSADSVWSITGTRIVHNGDALLGEMMFGVYPNGGSKTMAMINYAFFDGGGSPAIGNGNSSCVYTGTAFTSVDFLPSAANFTGTIKIMKLIVPEPR